MREILKAMEDKLREFFKTDFPDAVIREDFFRNQLSFYIRKEYLFDICKSLQKHPDFAFNFLMDICSAARHSGFWQISAFAFTIICRLCPLAFITNVVRATYWRS